MFGDLIDNAVPSLGARFHHVADLKWVSEPNGHIRNLLQFQAMKGATYSARWGFSVDFVPVLSGRKLAWKRSSTKADFDLCIDPIDELGRVPDWCSFDRDADASRVARAGVAAFEVASSDFARVANLPSLLGLFAERSRIKFARFSLSNYVQTDICLGLLKVACGLDTEGHTHLRRFCDDYELDVDSVILRKAIAEAQVVASGG